MADTYLPAGTATGNADAVRAAPIAQAFYLFADVLKGVDSQPRMEPGMTTNDGLLGPTSSFGVDFGVAADGGLYVRGRSGDGSQDTRATPSADAAAAKPVGLPLIAWLAIAFVAFKVLS